MANHIANRLNSEYLIELIRCHEELYDLTHPKYCDAQHKEEIWKEIARMLNVSVHVCKKAWVNLRDSYRRAIKRRKVALKEGTKIRKFRFEREMAFMVPHYQQRGTANRLLDDNEIQLTEETFKELPSTSKELEDNLDITDKEHCLMPFETTDSDTSLSANPKGLEIDPFAVEASIDETTKTNDVIDTFLIGIGATMKTFSPYFQNLAKSKIFAVVSELELQQIVENNKPQHTAGPIINTVGNVTTVNTPVFIKNEDIV